MNILRGGRSTFTGDVPVRPKRSTALSRNRGVSEPEAEEESEHQKLGQIRGLPERSGRGSRFCSRLMKEFLAERERSTRALSFSLDAATDEQISMIFARRPGPAAGGPSRVPGLMRQSVEQSRSAGHSPSSAEAITLALRSLDRAALEKKKTGPSFAIAVGLGVRRPGG